MSKSLKNFTSIDTFLKNIEDGARVLRLMIIKNHYRSPIEF